MVRSALPPLNFSPISEARRFVRSRREGENARLPGGPLDLHRLRQHLRDTHGRGGVQLAACGRGPNDGYDCGGCRLLLRLDRQVSDRHLGRDVVLPQPPRVVSGSAARDSIGGGDLSIIRARRASPPVVKYDGGGQIDINAKVFSREAIAAVLALAPSDR